MELLESREEVRAIRDSAAAIVPRDGDLGRIRRLRFSRPGFDRDIWRHMCALGWIGLRVEEGRGGIGLGVEEFCAIAQELGAGLAPEPFVGCAAVAPLLGGGVLEAVLAGDMLVAPAWQEATNDLSGDAGSTTFVDGKLTGSKKFVAVAEGIDAFVVSAGDRLVLVRRDSPGVSVEAHATQDGGWLCDLRFDAVPAEKLAGSPRRLVEETTLGTAFYLLGAIERAFEITLDYVKTRQQFGQSIGSFQANRHRFVDLRIQLDMARAVLAEAAGTLDASQDASARRGAVARAKARAADTAALMAREAFQMHGAIGYTDESDIGLYIKKLLSLFNACGSAHANRQRWMEMADSASAGDVAAPATASVLGGDYNDWSDEAFRLHVREWIEENYPHELPRFPTFRPRQAETKAWYERLARNGWLAPGWPKRYGGMGLSTAKRLIMAEELERHGCTRFSDQGVNTVGPMLIHFGSDEQRARFLPRILSGEDIWAQGYSEPGSGSDLASLRTEAVLKGDRWIVNGQKTWTSLAGDANWLHVLVRTDKSARKQAGISVMLIPTDARGVTRREFKNLAMHDEFCEVFFDNVEVPQDAVVGGVNGGWNVAKALLEFERIFFGATSQSSRALSRLKALSQHLDLWNDPVFRNRYAVLASDLADHSALYEIYLDRSRRGELLGPEVSMLKIFQTELYKRITQATVEIAGEQAAYVEASPETAGVSPSALWIQSLPCTVYGGSSEVQREIVSKQVLGL